MRQGLSLGASQHLALTPQLQQSIRLLQLSTMELSQEIEQMLQDNPFLEQDSTEQGYEEALQAERAMQEQANTQSDMQSDALAEVYADAGLDAALQGDTDFSRTQTSTSQDSAQANDTSAADATPEQNITDDWEGEGSYDVAPDDAEWGNDAPSRSASANDGQEVDAITLSAEHVSLYDFLHRQASVLRLQDEDRAALISLATPFVSRATFPW